MMFSDSDIIGWAIFLGIVMVIADYVDPKRLVRDEDERLNVIGWIWIVIALIWLFLIQIGMCARS
jgi:Na+/proline symporter